MAYCCVRRSKLLPPQRGSHLFLVGLDPEIEEEREEVENLRFAKESFSAERFAAEMGENTNELDNDHRMVVQGEVIEEPVEDDQAPRKRRRN
jgi:hypothetical protein